MKHTILLSLLSCFSLLACGGSDGASLDIDGTNKIKVLSAAEVTTFCDWQLAQWGEGQTITCGDRSQTTPDNTDSCVAQFADVTCDATVDQLEACILASSSAVKACAMQIPSECLPLLPCFPSNTPPAS